MLTDEGKYILINYGTVKDNPVKKIKDDILACLDPNKVPLPKEKIEKIICGHSSTNIHTEQFKELHELINDVEIELIGIDMLSMDLAENYPHIVREELGIAIDSGQFFDIEDFVQVYDANGINAPINCHFFFRKSEMAGIVQSIHENNMIILTGPSGIGKTRLALEACRKLENEGMKVYCVKSNGNLLYDDYTSANLLIMELQKAESQGTILDELKALAKFDLIIIDDFGLMNLDLNTYRNLFQLISEREGRSSIVIVSQIPVANWYDLFQEATFADSFLDPIYYKAYRLEFNGKSLRKKTHKN